MLLSPDRENTSLRIEVFVLCETAQEFDGRLNLLGTFETIRVAALPVVLPLLTVAIRLRYWSDEEGVHRCVIRLIDADGRPILEELCGDFVVGASNGNSSDVTNILVKLQDLCLGDEGEYGMELYLDDHLEASLPLNIECPQSKH
ncbi:hypothetical protein CfE428DRAFT_5996 [Chthoniobacter flavus Ellin428]|uniref:Uncharacterized protein n=2 Tax=Chthoniobacter flavus TaxID=191863 RepID=B4DAQ5_9BACT|nr:hypothetical protein CfE428DRAFT_5996 [Chthoniobacter flavus Ellin428]TCO92736.1 hypothetical protein EV701_10513 [Chthoniobacter flavus]